jgi:pilus assembly protein CpaB
MLVGAVCLLLYMQRFEREASGGALIPIVAARQELPLGTEVTEAMLVVREVPARYVEGRHVQARDLQRILGIPVTSEVHAGESVLWTDLANAEQRRDLSSLVRPGLRAVTIAADSRSTFGGLLRPGDRVDVLVTTERGDQQVTTTILQNALVLATGRDTGDGRREESDARASQVTLGVTLDQGQTLATADAEGTLTLVLRHPADITLVEGLPARTTSDVLRRPTPAPAPGAPSLVPGAPVEGAR